LAQPAPPSPAVAQDDPARWLGRTALLDLEDPKLRLRVHSLTQFCQDDRQKAVALYRFVKRMPIAKRFKFGLSTARRVMDAGCGDASEKATLLVAMLRIAGVPARLRLVTMRGSIMRGVLSTVRQADRPVLEVWIAGAWQQTDTYIHDTETMAAARQRLKDQGWEWGYGIHVEGHMLWDGYESAYAGGLPDPRNPMVVREVGLFHDPLHHLHSRAFRRRHTPWLRLLHWNLVAPMMDKAWRELREGTVHPGRAARKPS
jgi:transglutaminase-like putative cysteine protease